ncbi:MAG: dihydrolipoamide acetyltransferase family protein [Hyphomicrobiales bacterium]
MPTEVIMPKVDMDMASGTIAAWHLEEGQNVEKGAPLFDIETDKATMEVESPATGTLRFVIANKGAEIPIGDPVGWIFAEDEALVEPARAANESASSLVEDANSDANDEAPSIDVTSSAANESNVRATPIARRIATSKNISLIDIVGTGPRGRITRSDVENAVQNAATIPTSSLQETSQSDAKKTADKFGVEYIEVPVDRMRATIAARLTESKSTVPHFYLDMDCRIDKLLSFRSELNAALEGTAARRISINDLLVRACALTLAAVPEANASWANDRILQYKDANVSIAVAIDGGLMTPVVKGAQNKSIQTLSNEIADLATRAKSGKLANSEYQGGSFSISNLGMFGVKSFNAIINPPESMILAVGGAEQHFYVGETGTPDLGTKLSVCLSCDHRVVDGAVGAKWLSKVKSLLENPIELTLDPV